MTVIEVDIYAEITNEIEMKLKVDVGADGMTLVEITQKLHQAHPEMEFMTCDSETHHSVTCDGKKVKAIPAKIRIYHRHHEAPKALRAEIAAHAAEHAHTTK